ncbi:MAG: RNA methyltransferase [Verrucomicrobiales bacterium]|nr:RNA methyltransferase [Verrucomicrobiales bacterium]
MTTQRELIEHLGSHLTEHKRDKIRAVLAERTRHLTVLLEDINQPHNAAACLRSCDCFGLQDVHVVERRHPFEPDNDVALGSNKWLTIHRYHQPESALETLKARGYCLVATSPNVAGDTPATLPIDQPIALLFGSEHKGLTDRLFGVAERTLRLPMYGFTESFNISVTLALALSRLVERLRESQLDWQLTEAEKEELTLKFYRRQIARHDLLEEAFWKGRGEMTYDEFPF